MKVLGLIVEYNPFHHGHFYHLTQSKMLTGADYSVAVMSGHFMQRGEPAVTDKWTRAAMAVSCGVDLVLELPAIYACSSADFFARGSVLLLDQLGCVTDLCFGSEAGSLQALEIASELMAHPPAAYDLRLREALEQGLPYAAAQESALLHVLRKSSSQTKDAVAKVFNQPNNILGLAYLKHLKIVNSAIQVHTIKRIGAGYLEKQLHHLVSSATGIRHQYEFSGDFNSVKNSMPEKAYTIMARGIETGRGPVFLKDFESTIMILLKRSSISELARLPHVTEGLENRILSCIQRTGSISEFLNCVKNKRVPYTRLQRMLIHLLLNIRHPMASDWYYHHKPPYARILAFNDRGRQLIRLCQKKASIPLINKAASFRADTSAIRDLLLLDYRASRIYGSVLPHPSLRLGEPDLVNSPVYVAG
jgi:predicted nucleotidyltransferase